MFQIVEVTHIPIYKHSTQFSITFNSIEIHWGMVLNHSLQLPDFLLSLSGKDSSYKGIKRFRRESSALVIRINVIINSMFSSKDKLNKPEDSGL